MNPTVEKAAAAYMAPKLMKGFRLRWLVYGAAAYYGLKFLNKRGVLPNQTGAALDLIDRGIDMAKERVGFTGGQSSRHTAELAH